MQEETHPVSQEEANCAQAMQSDEPIVILLLTNRDSDNIGDQVIEACDIALITSAMHNLGYSDDEFRINSRAASNISKQYLATKDPNALKTARKLISEADVVVFGGAPLFNYRYQIFYERTAITLELAQEYGVPAIFSAIGVEGYDEDDSRCQRLKKTLNFDIVKRITTRDDLDSLRKFINNDSCYINKVSDPAVFAKDVFKPFLAQEKSHKVGLFIIRSNAFVDSGIKFNREQAARFWSALTADLEKNNIDYEIITSGHFGDEAFVDYLIRFYGIARKKCIFDMFTPEKLVEKISSYSAILTCRLHPSIIAYSLEVPSLSLVWNAKVPQFYEAIGMPDRALSVQGLTPESTAKALQGIIGKPAPKEPDYLLSVYTGLFEGLHELFKPQEDILPFTLDQLERSIQPYSGTTEAQKTNKIIAKMRRTYGKYNDLFDKKAALAREIRGRSAPIVNRIKGLANKIRKQKA